ncbi:MAG: glutaredoxin 3 [Candidatus Tokpelaia sp. JSC189]|nr:MAG: glutaredoxin 3 [Candidatus Tokpelaia sp. JSC189]
MIDATIYTKPGCPYCTRAKKLLNSKGVHYKEIVAAEDPTLRAEMVERANKHNTFPQIFINTVHIGGCDDLYALEKAGKLDSLLEAKGGNDLSHSSL